jgi:hypothetical protein
MQLFIHTIAGSILFALGATSVIVVKDLNYERSPLIERIDMPTQPDLFYPKNLCNIKPTSELTSKKINNFAYECMPVKSSWFLINSTEANYTDVVRNINDR